VQNLVRLPVFLSQTVLLPAGTGLLRAYEPKYVRMFEELRAEGSRAMFGHLLSPEHATEGMLGDAVGGLPRVGTAATITDIREHPEGGLVVAYEGVRRFQVISVDPSEPSAALHAWVEFLRDMHGPEEQAGVDAMERDLWGMFLELEAALVELDDPDFGVRLPEQLVRYAPPRMQSADKTQRLIDRAGSSHLS